MWKAILILFMTTGGTTPDSIAITEFPDKFITLPGCHKYIDIHRGDIMELVNIIWDTKTKNLVALHHKITCIQDMSGEAI